MAKKKTTKTKLPVTKHVAHSAIQMSPKAIKSHLDETVVGQDHARCREHLNRNGGWVEPSSVLSLRHQVLAHALSALNGHFKSEVLATPNQLKEQIDRVLDANNSKPVFGQFEEVSNA